MRLKRMLTALLLVSAWAFAAPAYDYNGVTVTAENGSIREIGDELLVTFNEAGTGKLTLDGYALARVMVVGGGGSGSTGRYNTNKTASGINYMGNGGSGGEAIEYDNHYLAAGAYKVIVGTGGAAVAPGDGKARTTGKSGGQSSFAGIVAKGGAGGVVETGSQNGTGSNTVKGWGSNLKTDISGETLTYSTGGAAATNATNAGSSGADRGCGGGGGGRTGDYKSGAGGKGVVIVRIKAASANPPATASFDQFVQYAEGVAVSPFDSIPDWAATITGTTNSTQRGHFSFTVSLKDGYVWSDTFGREDRTFKWAVVDDPSMGDTYLDVTKTVRADPSNPSNATISIIGHVPSEKVAVNVLFMGTMCYAHSLKPTTIQAAINSIAKRASVDWYLFHKQALVGNTGILRDYETDLASTIPDSMIHTNLSGSVAKGGVIDDNFVRNELDRQMQSNNHQALNSFMGLLYEVSQDPARSKRYDYIVLEFDGSRVADGYTTDAHEAAVAAFLKPYYDAGKVVWIVDNCAAGATEPFGPNGDSGRKNKYYTPCTYFHNGASTVLETDALYSGLIALTDPSKYLSTSKKTRAKLAVTSFSWGPSGGYRKTSTSSEMVTGAKTIYANARCDLQIPYDNADDVSSYLSRAIREKPYDLEFIDKIVDSGLEITAAHMSTSNVERAAEDLGWCEVSDPSVVSIDINHAAHSVNAVVSNMCSEIWAKLEIDVRDTGSFRAGAEPVRDTEGRLVATSDPNDGSGSVFKYDPGDDSPTAQGESPTLEPWTYNVYVVTGLVANGTLKIDGIETNEAFKTEGYDCHVTYEPNAGYELDSISVDGEKLTDAELEEFSDAYDFKNIDKDHEIVVVYKQSIQQMGIEAFPAEKFYDAEPTNITWAVTNAAGVAITDATVSLREKGTDDWIPAADFTLYVDTTNVVVEVKAEKTGFDPAEAEATVLVKPRPVTLVAASDSKVYDGLPLTNWTFEVKTDTTTPGYGFVKDEGVDRVTMTPESTVTLPDTVPNVIASEIVKPGTKLERNYVVDTVDGTLTVTAASMGIEAFPAEKFYDAEPTNVTWAVTNAQGVAITDATVSLREKNTTDWIPAADFVPYVDTTNVTVEVRAEKSGFDPVTAEATVLVKPRSVTLIAASDSKVYDGLPLTNWTFTVKEDKTTPGYGFVKDEGVDRVTMTPESTVTLPDTVPNVIASEIVKPGTKLERNYVVDTVDGTLTVTAATMGIEAFPAEKFYDAEPTNITWAVTNATGGVISDAVISLREKGADEWIPAKDFVLYVDTTNVTVEVRAEKSGFDPVAAEATVLVKPRPVTLVAASDSKVYDGLPLTNWTFEVKTDTTTPGYGFVKDEGVDRVTMTPESTVTLPDTVPNVIATEIVKPGTKLERNYVVDTVDGTLTVTAATMGIEAFPAEKFYDAEPTNITWAVTNAAGVAITDATISLREKNTTDWIPAADFALYVDTTNVVVEVKAEKTGFDPAEAEATVLVKPRSVTLIAASDSKVYDGLPLTNWTFEVKTDTTTPGYGFVKDEGVDRVTMTPESTVTLPDTVLNVIATEVAKEGTKLERNYVVDTVDGTLTVTAATMGIEAFDAEKFYDAEPTNITYVVTNAAGVAIVPDKIFLREQDTTDWIPAADFVLYVDTTNVTVEVKAEKTGFDPVEAEATVLVKPRPVTLIAASDSKVYDGLPLTNWTFEVKTDTTTPGYGFVKDEGVDRVTMTPESTVTLPDTVPNVIATEIVKPGTKLERNYVVDTVDGTLTVTAASMGIEAFPAEKFYDAEPTNITWAVTNAQGGVISDAVISLREKGTDDWIPAADFTLYVDTTNVVVEVRAEKSGFTPVTAEATVLVKPRPVTLVAASDSKVYDGLPLTNWTFTVKEDKTTPGYGFVKDEGVDRVTMTPESTVTLPDTVPNVIASEIVKPGTKLERNYVVDTVDGTLTVTAATMGIEAFPAEKFYDAEPTNITYVVTNAAGVAITDATVSLREKGMDKWIPAADFTLYVDTTNVVVEVRAEKSGFTPVTAEATVLVKPRPVTLVAASDSKVYDGLPLTNWTFTVKEDKTTPGYGFVKEEGVASVTMTPESTVTLPDTVPNVIATETAKPNTRLERNYILSTEPGTLTVTAASMGIEAFPAEKFYDAEPTNITWAVTNAAGVAITDATVSLREKGTDKWIPAADFTLYVDTTNVTVEVRAEKSGFDPVTAEATVLVKPRPVTLVAASDSKVYDGLPLTNWTFTVKTDTTTPGYGFVKDEGVDRVTMTPESTVTLPDTVPNVIATEIVKPGTKLERNYVVDTVDGTLTVTAASMGIEAFPAEKFYDAEPTNITWAVTNATGGVISDAVISLREKGADEWIPAADFTLYVDTTNVVVEVKAEKTGFDPAEAEATVLVKPRPVTLIAASDSKVYDGLPLTNWTFEVKTDTTTPGYGFVKEEGVERVTMTTESTVTLPDTVPNVIATEVAKEGTKLERNYIVSTVDGTLTVTAASMGIEAFPAEKFYDAEPTNITWAVTNAQGGVISDAVISLREKGTDDRIPAADFTLYVDTTNVVVEVKAEKTGFDPVEAEATVLVKPRPVTLIAASDSKTYDGLPLTNWTFTVKEDKTTPGYGFVKDEGVERVTMTTESTVTLPGSADNVIATEVVKPGTKLDRNYILSTVDGTLTVTAATMGIEAFDAEKFYDAEPTNVTWVVTNAQGVAITDAVISLREKGTDEWIPVADFVPYVDTTNVIVEVKAEKSGFDPVTAEATVLVKPRPVTLIAASDSKTYDGLPLTNWTFEVKTDTTTPGYGFVKDEGVDRVTMTPESTVTLPDTVPNVIATEIVKPGTKLERNYVVDTVDGTLTVTAATMGIEAFPAEKFYDAEPTNVTWAVTNAQGVAITDATVSLREKGTDKWIPVADFALYVDTTNVVVEVRAEKPGFDPVEAEATVLVKPRPVTLIAASDSKVYDGLPLTNWTFEVKTDTTTPGYGFVKEEGVDRVTMTPESTVTLPGSTDNVIATEVVKPGTKLDRNYLVTTEKGTLTVTAATMGIEAFPAEKFYDAEPTNITWVVTNAQGVAITDATVSLREKGADKWIPVADFTLYVDTTNVTVEVRAEKSGFDPVTAEATVLVKPRPVTLVAASDSKVYDGLPLTNWTFTVKTDTTTPGYGFVKDEGVDRVTMTPESTVTLPDTVPNVIATEIVKPGTKLERNYVVDTVDGTLTVTAASMGIEAFPAEKFYDAEPTNITWAVTNAQGGVISDAVISLREKGADNWIPAADFTLYVDTTNVVVEVRAEKSGFDPAEAEATVLVKPRPVTLIAASDSKTYDGLPLTNWTFEVKADTTTPGYGFVKDEGVDRVTMTPESTVTLPDTVPNVIATEVAKEGTKLERNYVVDTVDGTLTVTPAAFTASATPYDEFYDGQEHTIEVEIQKPEEAGEAAVTYSYEEGGTYLPIEDFEQLKDVTASGPVTVYAKIEVEGYATVVVNATVNIKPRIVVEQAESASKIFDGTPLVQPNHHEETDAEAERSRAKWGTVETLANSTGFVTGEGFAAVPMTAGSTITEPGVEDNVIDAVAVTLLEGTKPGNYIFFYLPGELAVIQRQEEVRRDPEVVIPEESKAAVEESDKKIEKTLGEMAKADQEESGEPYVKYQLTMTPTNGLSEATRTTPEKAAEDAKKQVELAESETGSKIDKVEFVDIVLERTYSKEEAEATAAGDYNKDNWEPLDRAEEHGNTLFEVVIPVEVPEGMELIGVTRSCDNKGTEILKPRDPNDPNAEGFVYDPETKTVTLYAYDFCVFGFMMKEKTTPLPPPSPNPGCRVKVVDNDSAWVYNWKFTGRTTDGVLRVNEIDGGCYVITQVEAIRVPASLKIQGYTVKCNPGCLDVLKAAFVGNSSQEGEAFWITKPTKGAFIDDAGGNGVAGVSFRFGNVIGRIAGKYEVVGTFTGVENTANELYVLRFAGQGSYDASKARVTSVSGCFAGRMIAPHYHKYVKGLRGCPKATVWDCVGMSFLGIDGRESTAAFGKWSMKYNATASSAFAKGRGRPATKNGAKWRYRK